MACIRINYVDCRRGACKDHGQKCGYQNEFPLHGAKSLAEGILATAREENVKIFKTKDALKGVAHRFVIVND